MKVFTVGLDDKEKQKANEAKKEDMTKIPIDSSQSTPAPSPSPGPIIIPRGPPRKIKGCGMMTWLVGTFLLILLCLTISEIAYNRQRDQAFLRLKWAELRQRMLGYELLSQAQNNQPQPPPVIDERLAFSNRRNGDMEALPLRETPTIAPEVKKDKEDSSESGEEDARFTFLRALLDKMRQKAEDMGLQGDMQVHVIEVKPIDEKSRAWQDGFGEVAVPHQNFGPHPNEEDYDNWENMRHHVPPPPPPPPMPAWEFERPQVFPRPRFPEFERPWMGPPPFENNFQRQQMNQPPFFFADAPQDRRDFFAPPPPPPQRMPWNQQRPEWIGQNAFPNNWNAPFYNPYGQQEPSVGQQNQFPFPVQNQPMIFPQQQPQPQQQQVFPQPQQQPQQQPQPQQHPWYMPAEEPRWDNNWQKHDMPMQPHPAAAESQWVDRIAGQDSQGIDNFEKQERFNVPVDIANDEEPVEVVKPEAHFKVNAWQHTQSKSAEEVPEVESAPVVSSDAVVDNKDFLPIRVDPVSSIHQDDGPHSGEKVDVPPPPIHEDAVDLVKKFDSPFFQIDDPNSFRH